MMGKLDLTKRKNRRKTTGYCYIVRRKRDSLRASQKGILNKHRNPNSLQEFCLFYFPEKNANEFPFFWKIKNPQQCCGFLFAEKEGFEPPDLLQSTVFKTAAFDRSAISPEVSSGIP
jgi:hypothetical protein